MTSRQWFVGLTFGVFLVVVLGARPKKLIKREAVQPGSNSLVTELKTQVKNLPRKRAVSVQENYMDVHCMDNFEVNPNMIIRTKESKALGANYLNETELPSFDDCLKLCCDTPFCNVAVYDKQDGSCYLFDCGSPQDFKCKFDENEYFESAALEISRHSYDISAWGHQTKHRNQLQELGDPEPKKPCSSWEFTCSSGECIAVYDQCNGIPQCVDGSDEDPAVCNKQTPNTTTRAPPVQHVRPAAGIQPPSRPSGGVNQWGREGERYNPVFTPAPSAFQHKNAGVQIPPQQQPPGWMPPPQGQVRNYPYGANNFQNTFDYSNYGYPPRPYPPQQPPMPPQRPQYPPQQYVPPPAVPPPKPQSKPSTTSTTTTTTAESTTHASLVEDPAEKLKNEILGALKDEDFEMETPSAAIFTLVVGMILSVTFAIGLGCRMRNMRKRGRKRNLAHDADGDYLVNGMYL